MKKLQKVQNLELLSTLCMFHVFSHLVACLLLPSYCTWYPQCHPHTWFLISYFSPSRHRAYLALYFTSHIIFVNFYVPFLTTCFDNCVPSCSICFSKGCPITLSKHRSISELCWSPFSAPCFPRYPVSYPSLSLFFLQYLVRMFVLHKFCPLF